MKLVASFVVGALVATGLVLWINRKDAPPPTPPPIVEAAPEPAPAPVPAPTPLPVVVDPPTSPKPGPKPSPVPKPSALPTVEPPPSAPAPAPAPAPVIRPEPVPPAPQPEPNPPAPVRELPKQRSAHTVTLPEGTAIAVRTLERISTHTHKSGDLFAATLSEPIVVDGFVIAEKNSRVEGRVAEADPAGRVHGTAHLTLELTSFTTSDAQRIAIRTSPFLKKADTSNHNDAAKVGIGAAIGAAIGAIAGGGKGAAIGAGAGGAAGGGAVVLTRGKVAEIAPETAIGFRLSDPVSITEKLR